MKNGVIDNFCFINWNKFLVSISLLSIGILMCPAKLAFSKVSSTSKLQVQTQHEWNQVRSGSKTPRSPLINQSIDKANLMTPKQLLNKAIKPRSPVNLDNYQSKKKRNVPGVKDLEKLMNPVEEKTPKQRKVPGVSDLERLKNQQSLPVSEKNQ